MSHKKGYQGPRTSEYLAAHERLCKEKVGGMVLRLKEACRTGNVSGVPEWLHPAVHAEYAAKLERIAACNAVVPGSNRQARKADKLCVPFKFARSVKGVEPDVSALPGPGRHESAAERRANDALRARPFVSVDTGAFASRFPVKENKRPR